MSQPWNFVKTFAGKSFEQNAKDTNNSVPKTKIDNAVKMIEETVALNKALEEMGVSVNGLPEEIVLPPSQSAVEIAVQVEEQQQGEKDVPNIRRKNQSKNRSNQKSEKKPKRRK